MRGLSRGGRRIVEILLTSADQQLAIVCEDEGIDWARKASKFLVECKFGWLLEISDLQWMICLETHSHVEVFGLLMCGKVAIMTV